MKVHLVDGTYELFRAFYGVPPAHDAAGHPVGAIRGLLSTLVSLLRERDVSHVAVAFDTEIESFRNQMFDGYKTGEGIEPDLFAQFELAERAASYVARGHRALKIRGTRSFVTPAEATERVRLVREAIGPDVAAAPEPEPTP